MIKTMSPAMRVILLTGGICLLGLILRTIWPGLILPETSLTLYGAILILAHMASPRIENWKEAGFDWMVSVLALSILPACAGVMNEPLWKAALVDGVFSAAVMVVMDSIDRRAELRRTGPKAFYINCFLILLAIQGFDHMFM